MGGAAHPGTNRLSAVVQGGSTVTSNTFDAAGNTVSDGTRSFSYNATGRMVQASAGGLVSSYTYNYNGQRASKSVGGIVSWHFYDDAGHRIGEYDAQGNPIQELVWLGNTPVAVMAPSLLGYIWTDHLDTPREISNQANQSLWKWDSVPFGETYPDENPTGLGPLVFNHRFPGQYFDQETTLHQNWNRDYDPRLGRFIEADPIGLRGGIGIYVYASNRPTLAIDLMGLTPLNQCQKDVLGFFFSADLLDQIQMYSDSAIGGDVQAFTANTDIYFAPNGYDPSTPAGLARIAHEILHSQQFQEQGVAGFLARYGSEYLQGRWEGMSHNEAYRHISAEQDAYDLEEMVKEDLGKQFSSGKGICPKQCLDARENP